MTKNITPQKSGAAVPPAPSLAETMLNQEPDPRRRAAKIVVPGVVGPPLVEQVISNAAPDAASRLDAAKPPVSQSVLIETVARQSVTGTPAPAAAPKMRPTLASLVSEAAPQPPRPIPLPPHSLVAATLRQFPGEPAPAGSATVGRPGAPSLAETMLSQQVLPPKLSVSSGPSRLLVEQLPTEPPAPRAAPAPAGTVLVQNAEAPDVAARRSRKLGWSRSATIAVALFIGALMLAAWVMEGRLTPWRR